jgi:low temperature requirement protein LtrA
MADSARRANLFRTRREREHHRVTFVELFFDLVFVFAVTQLSHKLLEDFSWRGVLQTALLLLAVWWVWIYTCWITNWLDPDRTPVRLMLFLLMLAGLGLTTSIPLAFESRGLVFATAYAGMQVGRTAFMFWTIPKREHVLRQNFARILAWLSLAAALWILGGLHADKARLLFWSGALIFEYVGPIARFWTPLLGASKVSDWAIEGGHLAERCALFIIIALGESVLVTGATFSGLTWDHATVLGFGAAFLSTVAMWWIYFDKAAEVGVEQITHASDPGRLGRWAYTYLHLPIVTGIILFAVGDELVLAHPTGHSEIKTVASVVGGPLAYLIGVILFKRAVRGWYQLSHLVGIGALVALTAWGGYFSPLALTVTTSAVMLIVAAWETMSLSQRVAEKT